MTAIRCFERIESAGFRTFCEAAPRATQRVIGNFVLAIAHFIVLYVLNFVAQRPENEGQPTEIFFRLLTDKYPPFSLE